MSDLIVFAFDDEESAFKLHDKLVELQKTGEISLGDAAVVVRNPDGEVKIKQLQGMTGQGAVGGGVLGLLIGAFFLAPWLGLVAGALGGALLGKRTDVGIDNKFIKEVSGTVEPGHSALFILVYRIVEDKVMAEVEPFKPKVLRTSLSAENEAKLREALGGSESGRSSIKKYQVLTQWRCQMISQIIIILAILFLLALILAPIYYFWQASKYRDDIDGPADKSD